MRYFTAGRAAWLGVAIVTAAGLASPPAVWAGDAAVRSLSPGSPSLGAPGLLADKACGGNCCATWWCPNDYRPKPCPAICLPRTCGGCDDYCPKRLPCVGPPSTCGFSNDYCAKPAPCVSLPGCWPSFYKCPVPLPRLPCGR